MGGMINQKSSLLFLLGFVLINAYIPGIVGASIPTGWLYLLFIIPGFIYFYDTRLTVTHFYGFLFIIYAILSLAWTNNFNIAYFIFLQFLVLCCVFCLGSALDDIRPVIIGLASGLIVSDIIGVIQYYYQIPVVFALTGNVAGLFVNKNIFCEVSAIILVSLLVFRLWWFIPLTIPGILMVHSRGAMLGLFVGGIAWLYKQNKNAAYIIFITVTVSGVIYYIHNSNSISIFERFDLWADTAKGISIFGNGIGSFEILYPYYATHIDTALARPRFAHNDLLHCLFEFGIFGTALVLVILYNVFKIKSDAAIILYTVGIISMFSYSLHIPVTGFIGFLVAGFVTCNDAAIQYSRIVRRSNLLKGAKRG